MRSRNHNARFAKIILRAATKKMEHAIVEGYYRFRKRREYVNSIIQDLHHRIYIGQRFVDGYKYGFLINSERR